MKFLKKLINKTPSPREGIVEKLNTWDARYSKTDVLTAKEIENG